MENPTELDRYTRIPLQRRRSRAPSLLTPDHNISPLLLLFYILVGLLEIIIIKKHQAS
jgi:hypothetical protein